MRAMPVNKQEWPEERQGARRITHPSDGSRRHPQLWEMSDTVKAPEGWETTPRAE